MAGPSGQVPEGMLDPAILLLPLPRAYHIPTYRLHEEDGRIKSGHDGMQGNRVKEVRDKPLAC